MALIVPLKVVVVAGDFATRFTCCGAGGEFGAGGVMEELLLHPANAKAKAMPGAIAPNKPGLKDKILPSRVQTERALITKLRLCSAQKRAEMQLARNVAGT